MATRLTCAHDPDHGSSNDTDESALSGSGSRTLSAPYQYVPMNASGLVPSDGYETPFSPVVSLSQSNSDSPLPRLARRASTVDPKLLTVLDLRLDRTLADVGRAFGVTRERIRQLEEKGNRSLTPIVREWAEPYEARWDAQLRTIAVGEEELFGDLRDPQIEPGAQNRTGRLALRALFPGAAHPVGFRGNALHGWWTLEPTALSRTLRTVARSCPLTDSELDAVLAHAGVPASVPARHIYDTVGSPARFHSSALAWVRSRAHHRDAAVALLRAAGKPSSSSKLAQCLGLTTRALYMNLARDQRVRQLRPSGEWALNDWTAEDDLESTFASPIEAVVGILRESGPLRRNELVRRVIDVYPVSLWAILNALQSDRVGNTLSGLWDLTERGAQPAGPKPPPRRPASISESADGRLLTFTRSIDGELLRGSGLVIKPYIGWRIGLVTPGMRRVFTSPFHPRITVRRSFGSCNISTLRQQAGSLGGRFGQTLLITLDLQKDVYSVGLASGQKAAVD
jgi:hypothetical protein